MHHPRDGGRVGLARPAVLPLAGRVGHRRALMEEDDRTPGGRAARAAVGVLRHHDSWSASRFVFHVFLRSVAG